MVPSTFGHRATYPFPSRSGSAPLRPPGRADPVGQADAARRLRQVDRISVPVVELEISL
ncbi:MAG: CRISPR-associated protein Cas5 [Gemmatimonadetes bacterium]|nr:CRISPR-associated protein Cas5 [Gemmatimonadota bacterium]MYE94463.1 CRISPR-associated protein Cas5 [Gemmatimonadota bacterium]MYJ11250.1 CRISPR-associated protein Cas5 [Gemmatimonadota bacterium]